MIRKTFSSLITLKGNPKYCVFTEPLWGVPHALYAPFLTLYMFSLGLEDAEIGILLSVGLFMQMFWAFMSGIITDKFGRKWTTFVSDIVSWSIPVLIWAFAQNFYWFLIAALFNSLWQISGTSWQCLLVEDAKEEKLVELYNWIYIAGLLAVFFAPISGYFIGVFSLVPVMRVLLVLSAISMTLKFIILYMYCTETQQGMVRMQQTKHTPWRVMILECKDVLVKIFKTPATIRVLILITLLNIQQLISNNFFSLFITQDLLIPEEFLAFFPIIRAAIMLIFFMVFQHRLNKFPIHFVMLFGLILYILAHVLLLNTPIDTVLPIVVFTAMDACAAALFLPRRDALFIKNVDPKERARIMGLLVVIMLGVSSPFGLITGVISGVDRRIPFMFNILLFVLMAMLVLFEKKTIKDKNQTV